METDSLIQRQRQQTEEPSASSSSSSGWNVLDKVQRQLPTRDFLEEGYGSFVNALAEGERTTWSRMIVEQVLQKYTWYFPVTHQRSENAPSIARAWRFYEHMTLPRRHVGAGVADDAWHRAEVGEDPATTELYGPWNTPQSAFVQWGTGIDLYFSSLKFFAVILFLAGMINWSSIQYYKSDDYYNLQPGTADGQEEDVRDPLLAGSAVCTRTEWVVCPSCSEMSWQLDPDRFAVGADETILVLKNMCKGAGTVNGIASFASLLFLLVSVFVFSYYLRAREVRFDEDKVTSSDYSLSVDNPPPDATDPDEWKNFFSQFATEKGDQVTVVTVALNNERLVQKLLNRRQVRRKLKLILPESLDMDNDRAVQAAIQLYNRQAAMKKRGVIERLLFKKSPDKMYLQYQRLTSEVLDLLRLRYDAIKVFVTFETEQGQRDALKALTVGKLSLARNKISCLPPQHVFRGKYLLKVREPCEPDSVRWLDLSAGSFAKISRRCCTLVATCFLLLLAGTGITKARSSLGPGLSGPLTSLSNAIFPLFIKFIMRFEAHSTEGSYQTSLYLKVTLFRWTLAGLLALIITPFTSTLSIEKTDLIPTIAHIMIADLYVIPIVKLLDIGGTVKKHLLAPRARTQAEMNMYFQGSPLNLGERYTDLTKVLFVVFFYAALFPAGFFFGSAILTIQYCLDKFSLLRLWGWSPLIGSELAVFSRRYFFTASLITMALVSAFAWAQFPYDNLCDVKGFEGDLSGLYSGVTTLTGHLVGGTGSVSVTQGQSVEFCDQSWQHKMGMALPPLPKVSLDKAGWNVSLEVKEYPWMSQSQLWLTTIYGWVAVTVVGVFLCVVISSIISRVVMGYFHNMYEADGESQNIDFSSYPDIFAFVPQVKMKGFPFPFLACSVDKIDRALIGWGDEDKEFDDNNLLYDVVPRSGSTKETQPNTNSRTGPKFSVITNYPTKWQLELMKKQ